MDLYKFWHSDDSKYCLSLEEKIALDISPRYYDIVLALLQVKTSAVEGMKNFLALRHALVN